MLASTVTPKVERYLEDHREEVIELYGTDEPSIDVVRERLNEEQPSQIINPIDVALELIDAIEAVKRRSIVLPLAMFHIGTLYCYFEVCLEDRKVPEILHESFSLQRARAYGQKPSKRKKAKLDKLLEPHLKKVRGEYEGGLDEPHHTYTRMYLNVHPELIEEIVATNDPRTINSKEREAWTEKDLEDYAVRILRGKISPIAREFGYRFGDKDVTIPRDD